jgi:hypothetical protein
VPPKPEKVPREGCGLPGIKRSEASHPGKPLPERGTV